MFATKRFELIELIIPANTGANGQTMFQSQQQLQSVTGRQMVCIRAIELFSDQSLSGNPLTAASPVAGVADIINCTITFVVSATESLKRIPLSVLSRVLPDQTNYVPAMWQLFLLNDIDTIDFSKSYVNNVAATTTAFSFLFGVHYYYEEDVNGKIVYT